MLLRYFVGYIRAWSSRYESANT